MANWTTVMETVCWTMCSKIARSKFFGEALALLADIDGTLDTWPSHRSFILDLRLRCYRAALGGQVTPDYDAFRDLNRQDLGSWSKIFRSIDEFVRSHHRLVPAAALRDVAERELVSALDENPIAARAGVGDFLDTLLGIENARAGIVTSSGTRSANEKLRRLGLAEKFSAIDVDDGHIEESLLKPSKKAFLRCESALFPDDEDLSDRTLVVLEDSLPNLEEILASHGRVCAMALLRDETIDETCARLFDLPGHNPLREALVASRLLIMNDFQAVAEALRTELGRIG